MFSHGLFIWPLSPTRSKNECNEPVTCRYCPFLQSTLTFRLTRRVKVCEYFVDSGRPNGGPRVRSRKLPRRGPNVIASNGAHSSTARGPGGQCYGRRRCDGTRSSRRGRGRGGGRPAGDLHGTRLDVVFGQG